jgi:uncharacterized protein YndB with AHSA1/START domain
MRRVPVFEKTTTPTSLRIRHVFNAPRQKVFEAWTTPELLTQWFHPQEGFRVTLAEVDLREGGEYRIGLQPPGEERILVVSGEYQEIQSPEKLVFTWMWESDDPDQEDTLVTLEFFDRGGNTELVLTHERFANAEARDQHAIGWEGCLSGLVAFIERKER